MKRLSGRHLDRIIAISMSAIVLLGMSLRVHLLDGQSFWSDEGISLLRSALPLGEMLRNMPVEHVPGYFVLLFGWLRTAGTSDYALRFLSVCRACYRSPRSIAWRAIWAIQRTGAAKRSLPASLPLCCWRPALSRSGMLRKYACTPGYC
jgi:hypothetical protein